MPVIQTYNLVVKPNDRNLIADETLPPNLHLIIPSRSDPALPLARLRARGQLLELRARDLRFTEGCR